MRAGRGWLAIGVLGLALGCRPGAGSTAGARVEVRWTGAEAASFQAPATAEWCDTLRLLQIIAMSGDTGIGIAIYPRELATSGSYTIRAPDSARAAPPSAAIGLRWFSQTAVRGFQSDSGRLSLTRGADSTLSGRFTASARPATGKGPLSLTGSFEGLRERPATRGCTTPPRPPPPAARPDSGAGID